MLIRSELGSERRWMTNRSEEAPEESNYGATCREYSSSGQKAQTQTNDVGRHREAEEQVVCHGHLHNSRLTNVDHDKEDKGMRKPHLLDFHLSLMHCLGEWLTCTCMSSRF